MLKSNLSFLNPTSERSSAAFGTLKCFLVTGFKVDLLSTEKQRCLPAAQMQ